MDPQDRAKERLFSDLYHELHRLAERALLRDGRQLPISATTLLHESYLSVSKTDFTDSQRFLAYAARTMHGLIIDEIRRRRAQKHGGSFAMIRIEPGLELDHEASTARDDELSASTMLCKRSRPNIPSSPSSCNSGTSAVCRSRKSEFCAESRAEPCNANGKRRDRCCSTC